jgi:hypothetical protein
MRGGETVQIPDLALETSIYEVKDQYAKQTSLPHEKIKVLLNKKPAADLKTLKELGVTGDVEFSVMVLGGGGVPAAPPAEDKMDIDEQGSAPGSEKAQAESAPTEKSASGAGPSGPGALNTVEFWNDLQDFLTQRLRDTEEAQRLSKVFKMAYVNQ